MMMIFDGFLKLIEDDLIEHDIAELISECDSQDLKQRCASDCGSPLADVKSETNDEDQNQNSS